MLLGWVHQGCHYRERKMQSIIRPLRFKILIELLPIIFKVVTNKTTNSIHSILQCFLHSKAVFHMYISEIMIYNLSVVTLFL